MDMVLVHRDLELESAGEEALVRLAAVVLVVEAELAQTPVVFLVDLAVLVLG